MTPCISHRVQARFGQFQHTARPEMSSPQPRLWRDTLWNLQKDAADQDT